MLQLDGSAGEGGGQILRTALALSLVTATPFEIRRIRAGRRRPGLLRQHLTAVQAAIEVGAATASGAELGSSELSFRPGDLRHGDFDFSVGSAGSASLVVQTVLPAMVRSSGPSSISVEGGTHNLSAPPFEFLARSFLALVGRMGPELDARLERAGFYPAGGGRLTVRVRPSRLRPLILETAGEVRRIAVEAMVAGLPRHIAQRELAAVSRVLPVRPEDLAIAELPRAWGPGNVVTIIIERERLTEVFTGFGRRGVRAEQVGREAATEARRYLESGAAVDAYLADQLLLPLALAGGGRFTTPSFTAHAATNASVIERFLPVEISTEAGAANRCRVEISS